MSDSIGSCGSPEVGGPEMTALAEAAISALLGRIERQRRDPDLWESWHTVMALQAFAHRNHREAIHWIGTALLAQSERPQEALKVGATTSALPLVTLRALFEGVRSLSPRPTMLL